MVRPTSAADINSLGPLRKAASPAAPMRDPDLLLRLSGRIVKGCRLVRSVAPGGSGKTIRAACRGMKLNAAGMRPRSQAERGIRQAHQQKLRVENQRAGDGETARSARAFVVIVTHCGLHRLPECRRRDRRTRTHPSFSNVSGISEAETVPLSKLDPP